jgi:hypothetical protein
MGFRTNPTLVRATAPATIFPWLDNLGNAEALDRVELADAILAISGDVDGLGEGICRDASDMEDVRVVPGDVIGMTPVGDCEKNPVCERP